MKKWLIGGLVGLGLLGYAVANSPTTPASTPATVTQTTYAAPTQAASNQAASAVTAPTTAKPAYIPVDQRSDVQLSNDNHYTNIEGNTVHSPAYAPSIPPGASAQCRDGSYSFSQHRSGTCSHHGGVASWL